MFPSASLLSLSNILPLLSSKKFFCREVRFCFESERNHRFLVSRFRFHPTGRLAFVSGRWWLLLALLSPPKARVFPDPFDLRLCSLPSHCFSFWSSDDPPSQSFLDFCIFTLTFIFKDACLILHDSRRCRIDCRRLIILHRFVDPRDRFLDSSLLEDHSDGFRGSFSPSAELRRSSLWFRWKEGIHALTRVHWSHGDRTSGGLCVPFFFNGFFQWAFGP